MDKIEFLKSRGWQRQELSLERLMQDPVSIVLPSLRLMSRVSREVTRPDNSLLANVLAIFGSECQDAYDKFLNEVDGKIPEVPYAYTYVMSSWTYPSGDKDNRWHNNGPTIANGKLNAYLVSRIVDLLGTPKTIKQWVTEEKRNSLLVYPVEKFRGIESIDILNKTCIEWDGVILIAGVNLEDLSLLVRLCFNDEQEQVRLMNEVTSKGVGVFIAGEDAFIGKPSAKYSLQQMEVNRSLRDLTNQVKDKIEELEQQGTGKLNVLLVGKPGIGKTSWVNAFTKEVLSPLGYVIVQCSVSNSAEYRPTAYLNKVCIVINDADNLAISREDRRDGTTEDIMSKLDGNSYNSITPFDQGRSPIIITIMTCNDTSRWDKAALRKGRIDIYYEVEGEVFQ